jgi:acetyl/propionyl-CoA carboxylase alpha subunit
MKYIATIGDNEYVIELLDDHRVLLDGKIYQVDFNALSNEPVFSLLIDGKSFEAYLYEEGDALNVLMQGRFYRAVVEDEREKRLRAASRSTVSGSEDFHLKAPMPGLVVMVPVKNGQQVEKGDVLLILESMKMQNELKSPRSGYVARVRVRPGDRVEQHETMLSVV